MKIALLNVKYSPNLGDGVIAECIEHQLKDLIPNSQVYSLDISGMDAYGASGSIVSSKLHLMEYVRKLPQCLLKPVFRVLMPMAVKKKYAHKWSNLLNDCDCMVIGGGQLLMDVDQYFPMRIEIAVNQANPKALLSVYAVGVSNKMTKVGLKMFSRVFAHNKLVFASARDANASENFSTYFPNLICPIVTRDPGLLASIVYGLKPFSNHSVTIAFGVSDPASLTPHADSQQGVVCSSFDFYLEALKELTKNHTVHMFTNGEDYSYLDQLAERIKLLPSSVKSRVKVLPRALEPYELVRQIYDSKLVIAHRLHANIISYSLGIPHIGLGWDNKLISFFDSIDRTEFIINSNQDAVQKLIALTGKALKLGIDKKKHEQVMQETTDGLKLLANAISIN